jgi:hypothetical protein
MRPGRVQKMHRRLILAMTMAIALGAVAAAPASAAGPERYRLGPYSADVPAGQVCDFALHLAVTDAHATVMTFPVDRRGDQLVQYVGQETVVATNSDDDITVTVQEGVRIAYVYHANGTIDLYADGISIDWYFPGDVGGPALIAVVGRVHDSLTSTYTTVAHEVSGRSWDLCAALAP